jgi:hypothetical protein
MAQIIATLFTTDERPVEISARPAAIELMFLILPTAKSIDALRFDVATCLELEDALRTARLRVVAESAADEDPL